MTATAEPNARPAHETLSLDALARTFAASGVQVLAFSIPYLWLWTDGLDTVARFFAVLAHSTVLLAIGATSVASDQARGITPRLMVRPQEAGPEDAKRAGSWTDVLNLVAVAAVAALLAAPAGWMLPAAIAVLFVVGLLWAHAPLWIKYFGICETIAPLVVLGLPVGALVLSADTSPALSSVVAAATAFTAIVLATHLRDRTIDLADDVPTAATRQPVSSESWLHTLAFVTAIAVLLNIHVPLEPAELLGIVGAAGFVAATLRRTWRVPSMVTAHLLVGVFWVLG